MAEGEREEGEAGRGAVLLVLARAESEAVLEALRASERGYAIAKCAEEEEFVLVRLCEPLENFEIAPGEVVGVSEEEAMVVLLAGQSNMSGRGVVREDDPLVTRIQEELSAAHVLQVSPIAATLQPAREPMHYHTDLPKQHRTGVGPASSFAAAVATSAAAGPSRQVILVPTAVGGSYLDEWLPDNVPPTPPARCAYASDCPNLFCAAFRQLARLRKPVSLVLWHQGESDATTYELASTYGTRFERFYDALQTHLCAFNREFGATLAHLQERVPVLTGTITAATHKTPKECVKIVREAQLDMPRRLGLTMSDGFAVVDTQGLPLQSDGLHLDTRAQSMFGRALALCHARVGGRPSAEEAGSSASLQVLNAIEELERTTRLEERHAGSCLHCAELRLFRDASRIEQEGLGIHAGLVSLTADPAAGQAVQHYMRGVLRAAEPPADEADVSAESCFGRFAAAKAGGAAVSGSGGESGRSDNFVLGHSGFLSIYALLTCCRELLPAPLPEAGREERAVDQLLETATHSFPAVAQGTSTTGPVIVDLGCGHGGVVATFALLMPYARLVYGIDFMHSCIRESAALVRALQGDCPMAATALYQGSFASADEATTGWAAAADLVFAGSTCFSPDTVADVHAQAISRMRPGSLLVLLDHDLGKLEPPASMEKPRNSLELLRVLQCAASWGTATARVYKVVVSS